MTKRVRHLVAVSLPDNPPSTIKIIESHLEWLRATAEDRGLTTHTWLEQVVNFGPKDQPATARLERTIYALNGLARVNYTIKPSLAEQIERVRETWISPLRPPEVMTPSLVAAYKLQFLIDKPWLTQYY